MLIRFRLQRGKAGRVMNKYMRSALKPWDVYYEGQHVDTVFFTHDCDRSFVRRAVAGQNNHPSEVYIEAA